MVTLLCLVVFFFSSRSRHTRCSRDWSSDVCSSDPPSENAPASNKVVEAVKLRPEGFFEAVLPTGDTSPPPPGIYRIQIRTHYGETFELYDPYAFPCVLTEFDLYLMGEGRHYDTYQ